MVTGPESLTLQFNQFLFYFPAPGHAVLRPLYFFGKMKNYGIIIFGEESAAFLDRRNLRRAGSFLAITAAAKHALETDPVGHFNL